MREAEQESLADYLRETLTHEQCQYIGLISFNQWSFALGAVVETALAAREIGSEVTVGLWSGKTPLYDTGWTAHRGIARFFGSASRDENAYRVLRRAGIAKRSFVKPPLRHWNPVEPLPRDPDTHRAAIRQLTYRASGMGRSILQVHPDDQTPIRDDYEWPAAYLQQAMHSYAWAYDQARELISDRGLTTVVVYNGRFTHDRAVAAAAEAEGAQTLYYDTGGYETDFDLTVATTHDWPHLQGRMTAMYDRWSIEGVDDRDAIGSKWFTNRQRHADANNAIFVEHQEQGHLSELPQADQLVAFFSSSGDEIAELELDWSDYLGSQENALRLLADACRARAGTALVVRTHPHMGLKPTDDLERWNAAVGEAAPDAHYDPFSKVDSYELMRRADIVFTYGSTSGVEAGFMGRPVVVMGPSAYDELGCAHRISSSQEIVSALDQPPETKSTAALPYGLMMQRRGFNFSYLTKSADGLPAFEDVELAEANELTRKVSDFLKGRQVSRLSNE